MNRSTGARAPRKSYAPVARKQRRVASEEKPRTLAESSRPRPSITHDGRPGPFTITAFTDVGAKQLIETYGKAGYVLAEKPRRNEELSFVELRFTEKESADGSKKPADEGDGERPRKRATDRTGNRGRKGWTPAVVQFPTARDFTLMPDITGLGCSDTIKVIEVGGWRFWVYRWMSRWEGTFENYQVASIGTDRYIEWYEEWRNHEGYERMSPHATCTGWYDGQYSKFASTVYEPMFGPFAYTTWDKMPGKTYVG